MKLMQYVFLFLLVFISGCAAKASGCTADENCSDTVEFQGLCVNHTCVSVRIVPKPSGYACESDQDCIFWASSCGCGCVGANERIPPAPSRFCALSARRLMKECTYIECRCVSDVCVAISY